VAGLLTTVLTLPLAPVRAFVALARVLQGEAERQMYDPGAVRRELEALDEAYEAGAISDDQYTQEQQDLLGRLIDQPDPRL
jgi:antirestriction protein